MCHRRQTPPRGHAQESMLRGLRRERRRLLRQLKLTRVHARMSEEECKSLCAQAIRVIAFSVSLGSVGSVPCSGPTPAR